MKKKIMSMVIAAAAMALSLVGCGVDISSIGLPSDVVIEKGETQQLEIEYGTDDKAEQEKIAEAASKLTIEWTSSDEEVVTVDATGLITAVGAGEADVTASAKDVNISSTTHVKVVITPTGVEAPEALELVTNGENSKNLDAKMTPEDATEVKLAYESSDESVATVDENGLVTAVADGECTITTYVVADAPATAETATQEAAAVVTDEETPTGGENSEAVATPDNLDAAFGVVPEELSATTKVTVTTKVESITLDKTEGILNVGNTVTITATVAPEVATNPAVTWSSSDESVATVDETGKITAVATGNATITATSEDDSSVSANYELTVQQKKAAATTTKNNYSSSTSAGTSAAPSYTAPTQPVTPSAPAVETPAPAPAPDPAPAPAPDPAPAPAEPSQPSGGSGGWNFDDGSKPEDSFGQSSGIDWTQGATRS